MRINSQALGLAFFLLGCRLTPAAELVFQSGPARVELIELYTSEGCSSCPPAEKWLGELRHDSTLWQRFVPVAFHVNYWDHLGWKDVLASKAFTEREHAHAAAWRTDSVYTPCFVRNGEEWRPREQKSSRPVAADVGRLTLRYDSATSRTIVEFMAPMMSKPTKATPAYDVYVALLGGGVVSDVRKGENAGRKLEHEFVALRLETARLKPTDQRTWSTSVVIPARTDITASRHAIAAWVTKRGELAPIQATGGWLE